MLYTAKTFKSRSLSSGYPDTALIQHFSLYSKVSPLAKDFNVCDANSWCLIERE